MLTSTYSGLFFLMLESKNITQSTKNKQFKTSGKLYLSDNPKSNHYVSDTQTHTMG